MDDPCIRLYFPAMRAITGHPSAAEAIPAFHLYGEADGSPEQLHWESIAARSRLHDWHIQPHRHAGLYQLLVLEQGAAHLLLDGHGERVCGPLLAWITPLCVHGFHFDRDVQGHVLTLAAPLVDAWARRTPALAGSLEGSFAVPLAAPSPLLAVLQHVSEEHAQHALGRPLMLEALAMQLLVLAARIGQHRTTDAAPLARGAGIVKRFLLMAEDHYQAHLPLQHYADTLGISVGRLGQLCRQHTAMSAQKLLQQRLMLEARRCLLFTSMSVQQVAAHTGFADAAYFSRVFSRHAGCPPQRYRELHAG